MHINLEETFRAAYVSPEGGSKGVGVLLTTPEQANLTDEELVLVARQVAAADDVQGEIVNGDWTE
jgi:hypothetical protein